MADYSEIAKALDIRLGVLTGLPDTVQYDNTIVELSETGISLEATLLPSETTYTTLGLNAKGNESGVYQITVVTQTKTGRGLGMAMAQKIRDHFYHGLLLTQSKVKVRILKASLHKGKVDVVNYRIPVSVYYLSFS